MEAARIKAELAAKVAAAANARPFLFLRNGIEAKGEGARRVALLTVSDKLGDDRSSTKRRTPGDHMFTEEELALMDIGDE